MVCLFPSLLLSSLLLVPATDPRPNIVLVMADDQGWGDVGYNGHPVLQTPHLDRAAAAGLKFDRFYAAAPVCSPTRASVLTGRHPNRMGVFQWGFPLRPQETTLAEALQQAGYATAHFGKWHLGSVRRASPAHPGHHGFQHWLSAPNFFDNDPILSRQGAAVQLRGESSGVTVDAALRWIEGQCGRGQPFLAVIWFGSPHGPHRAAAEDRARYPGLATKLRNFYGEVSGMDRAFGRLRRRLAELQIRDDTLLWYCSDNGALPGVGSTGGHRGRKGKLYEGGLLVPAFLEWPSRISQARSVAVRCNTYDIYPTLLDIAGISVAQQAPVDGISLQGVIDGSSTPRKRPMGFWNYPIGGIRTPSAEWMRDLLQAQRVGGDLPPHATSQRAAALPDPPHPADLFTGHAAWIAGDWKLHRITSAEQRIRWQLYDLARDPAEKKNLLMEEQPRFAQLRQGLESWLQSVVHSLNGCDYRPSASATD